MICELIYRFLLSIYEKEKAPPKNPLNFICISDCIYSTLKLTYKLLLLLMFEVPLQRQQQQHWESIFAAEIKKCEIFSLKIFSSVF